MREIRDAVALLVFVVCLAGSLPAAELEPLPDTGDTVATLMERFYREKSRPQVSIIAVDWEDSQFIIPAAGSLQGNQGTYYRSDVTIANRRSQTQRIAVLWIAQGVNNGSRAVQYFNIAANTTVFQADFVATSLNTSGLGSVVVIGVDAAGNPDLNASLDGFSRIWTPQPNSTGTVSQEFAAVDYEDSLATSYGYGLRQDPQYRTNIGFVNLASTPNTYTTAIVGTGGSTTFTQDVLPYSMQQRGVPAGNWGNFYVRVSSAPSNLNWWSAYASSTDNITGDGWVSHVH
jgi:hypothetical protein